MSLHTLHVDRPGNWSVEEDARGRLWMEVVLGAADLYAVHHPLTPEETSAFRRSPSELAPLARRIRSRPREFFDARAESAYRGEG